MTNEQSPSMPEINIDKVFSALDDSVKLINDLVNAAEHSDDIDARVWRNWKHVEIMLDKDFVKNAGKDLSVYTAAVTSGSTFAPNEPTKKIGA